MLKCYSNVGIILTFCWHSIDREAKQWHKRGTDTALSMSLLLGKDVPLFWGHYYILHLQVNYAPSQTCPRYFFYLMHSFPYTQANHHHSPQYWLFIFWVLNSHLFPKHTLLQVFCIFCMLIIILEVLVQTLVSQLCMAVSIGFVNICFSVYWRNLTLACSIIFP